MAGEAKLGSTSRALARGLGGAGPAAMEGGRPVPGLALEVAHADLDASTQRMESVEPCRLGLWAIGALVHAGPSDGMGDCSNHPPLTYSPRVFVDAAALLRAQSLSTAVR